MLTGHTVFTGEPMAVMIDHARTSAPSPSKIAACPIPGRLEEIVLACLEKAPERRPSSAIELWSQLGEVPLVSPWTSDRAESWCRNHLPESARPSASDSSGELKAVLQHDL
jgi:hypothetical protein